MARYTEGTLKARHPHIVDGSLQWETGGKYKGKQTVMIKTRGIDGEFDGNTRRVATSDLHQVFWTEETKAALDRAKRSSKAKVNRALLKLLTAPVETTKVEEGVKDLTEMVGG